MPYQSYLQHNEHIFAQLRPICSHDGCCRAPSTLAPAVLCAWDLEAIIMVTGHHPFID